uniref:Uncharacterized protein n=1 Tax=Aegilops tauschii subsp. strangulata TaxID=200361 RepID=A0A453MRK9_AEGTS
YYVVKFLKENGLLGCSRDYYYTVKVTGKESVEKFICPHKEAAPHLTEDYAAAWKARQRRWFMLLRAKRCDLKISCVSLLWCLLEL